MIYKGKSVFEGVAIGRIFLYKKYEKTVKNQKAEDADIEKSRFFAAKEAAKKQLEALYDRALSELGKENAAIFEVHGMMLDDLDYIEYVTETIETQKVNAEYAVDMACERFSGIFESMDDEYMKARSEDVKDICNLVIGMLNGNKDEKPVLDEPVILVADDLTPSETVQLDRSKVLSFVTKSGSANSHTAILARAMNIPALVGVDFLDSIDQKTGIVDGYSGQFIVDFDEKTLEKYREIQKEDEENKHLLKALKGKKTVTKSGKKVDLYANISGVCDLDDVMQNDGEGVGLFRSEYLYLESEDFPGEEEQFKAYKTVAKALANKKVIIRTLDIGADKQVGYFNLSHEENPALGCRGIRICLERPDILKTQLRALLRAGCYGNISVMYPMITSVWEIQKVKEIVEECKEELKNEGISYADIEQGIMIETPAAVFISDELAKEVDFFSIGTNDLSQYLLAIDRQNPGLDEFFDARHPAVLKAVKTTIENGHKAGIRVGICGELAFDTELVGTFIEMGVDELSVSPSQILKTRDIIRKLD